MRSHGGGAGMDGRMDGVRRMLGARSGLAVRLAGWRRADLRVDGVEVLAMTG